MNLNKSLKSIIIDENSIPIEIELPKLNNYKNFNPSYSIISKSSSVTKESVQSFKIQAKTDMSSENDTSSIRNAQFAARLSPALSKKSVNSKYESHFDNKSTITERIKEVNFDDKSLSQWSKIKSQMLLPKLTKSTGSDSSQVDRKARIRFYDNYIRLRTDKKNNDLEEKKRIDRYEPTYQLGPKKKFNKLEAEFIIKDVFHNSLYLFSTESSELIL